MQRRIYERFDEVFPPDEFSIQWGREQSAPEYPAAMNMPTPRKCAFRIVHGGNSEEALEAKLAEIVGSERDNPFSFFTDDPTLDFDPATKISSINGVIYWT